GNWEVANTKRQSLLEGNENWNKFDSKSSTELILLGIGNVEKYTAIIEGKPFEGTAVRIFDPKTRLWSIYWSDSNNGTLDPPMVGSFDGKVGDFYSEDHYLGHRVLVRFNWNATDLEHPVWSQAFSVDDGLSWEWNWYMHFSRNMNLDVPALGINVMELRNYILEPGKVGDFVRLFRKELIAPQVALGGYPMGEYAPKINNDHLIWFRGFESMKSRGQFLNDFYYGAVWKKNRTQANGLLVNNDNVHLLKPLLGLEPGTNERIDRKWFADQKGITVIDYYISNQKRGNFIQLLRGGYLPAMRKAGIEKISFWISEDGENTFPRLPVFQDQNLTVSIAFYKNETEYHQKIAQRDKMLSLEHKKALADAVTLHSTEVLYPITP
ncbi:hypothetical protein Q9L58_010704, partial [Maublancomyces gigas]